MSEQYIAVEGRRVRVVHGGAGRPLVLLHGWSFNADDWVNSGIFAKLAASYEVYAVDMPYGVKTKSERFQAPRPEYAKFLRRSSWRSSPRWTRPYWPYGESGTRFRLLLTQSC